MENQDNIGDFFRKNLKKSDNSGDDWDRPDANVWANAQAAILEEEPKEKPALSWLYLLAFLLISCAIGVYVWSLKKQMINLEETIEQQEIAVNEQKQKILDLEQKIDVRKLEHSKEIANLNNERAGILKEKKSANKELLKSRNKAVQLQKENDILESQVQKIANQINDKSVILVEEKVINLDKKEVVKPISPLTITTNLLAVNDLIEMPDLAFPKLIQERKIEKNKWKVGIDYSFLNLKMPANNEEKDDIKSLFNVENTVYLAPVKGISVAYSPKKNLYIRAGFQQTEGKIERIWKISEDYDKSGEYLDADGKVNNDLNYGFNTPYAAHDGAINVKVPEGTELEDKDNVFAEISDYQVFDYKKVSLGAEYLLNKGKFQWQVQAGLSWNNLSFKEYFSEAEVKVNGEVLQIDKVEIKQKSDVNKSFIGLYSGVGLNYNISPHWSVGTNLNYNFNLISNQKSNFSVSDLLAREVGLAVNYHF